ncbi:MAG: hypothetical protein E6713_13710 [Sporomusaceae bacterium]|nr:hypothetical protein [Sporomusaceae bacterium]
MGYYNDNIVDDTIFEFPKSGFWLLHVVGSLFLVWLGMRFAMRRMPLAIIVYRLLRLLRSW